MNKALVAGEERKIFKVPSMRSFAFFLGILFLFGTYSICLAETENLDVSVYIKNTGKNLNTRARLKATRKIYRELITGRLLYDDKFPNPLKGIINKIYYMNYVSKIHIKGFKLLSRKIKGKKLEYIYAYNKVYLPKWSASEFIKKIGHNIHKSNFKIHPIHAMELSLNFPRKIPLDSALKIWNDKYKGFMKYALKKISISDTSFLRQPPIKTPVDNIPKDFESLLMLNDTVPLNLLFCDRLAIELEKRKLIKILERVVKFCLKSPRIDNSVKNLEAIAVNHDFISKKYLIKNRKYFHKIEEEKKTLSEEYFDIEKFNSLSAIINSSGKLPVIFRSTDCSDTNSDIISLAKSFEKTHSVLILGLVSHWFSKNNFPTLHKVVEVHLNQIGLPKNKNVMCNGAIESHKVNKRSVKIKKNF